MRGACGGCGARNTRYEWFSSCKHTDTLEAQGINTTKWKKSEEVVLTEVWSQALHFYWPISPSVQNDGTEARKCSVPMHPEGKQAGFGEHLGSSTETL